MSEPFAAGPPAVATRPPRSAGRVVLGLVIGLVLGAGGVTLGWVLSSGGGTSAGDDAAAACDALGRLDPARVTDKGAEGEVALDRWGAAVSLSASAAAADGRYKPLAEAVRTSINAYQTTFDPGNSRVGAELQRARTLCADLPS